MMKRGLPHAEHLRLGQVLSGVRAQLHHEWVMLLNAYPQTGERSLPAKHLETAWEALDAARKELPRCMTTSRMRSIGRRYGYR
jgi:hypothetical protein